MFDRNIKIQFNRMKYAPLTQKSNYNLKKKIIMNKSPFFDGREYLFENPIGFVIFDNFPVSEGHSLIIPKRIYSNVEPWENTICNFCEYYYHDFGN